MQSKEIGINDIQQIYVKTSKGQIEVQKRIYKLPASLRRLLIMVDGHSTVGQMLERFSSMGDINGALLELECGGFIAGLLPPDKQTTTTAVASTDSDDRLRPQNIRNGADATYAAAPELGSTDAQCKMEKEQEFVYSSLEQWQRTIQQILSKYTAPNTEYWMERFMSAPSKEVLQIELEVFNTMLPRIFSRKQAAQLVEELAPLLKAMTMPSA